MDRPDLAGLPDCPGVYSFIDASGATVYVGKAKSLRDRLTSYFVTPDLHARTQAMLASAVRLAYATCTSEAEALLLEREMIHSLQPRFNVRLRHGSGYPGLTLTESTVPALRSWHGDPRGKGVHFGPFPMVGASALLDAASGISGVRTCKDSTLAKAVKTGKACLLGEIGQCLAPCLGGSAAQAHAKAVKDLTGLLSGRSSALFDKLDADIRQAAASENFESAAVLHRRRELLAALPQAQLIESGTTWTGTVTSLARDGHAVCLALTRVEGGRVRGVSLLHAEDDPDLTDDELESQLKAQAETVSGLPPTRSADRRFVTRLLEFTSRQAYAGLAQAATHPWAHGIGRDQAARDLMELLGLSSVPERIEAIDVSHTGGRNAVAALVVLVDGVPTTHEYRHVRISDGGDDFAGVAAAVTARFSSRRLGLRQLPDVLLIDGGPLQVEAAREALEVVDPQSSVTLLGLAKRLEEVWLPSQAEPLILPRESPALRLLQLARDEAHRTAITRHRRARDRQVAALSLEDLDGVGPARAGRLLSAFGSVTGVLQATRADLASVLGEVLGDRVYEQLHSQS